MVGTPRSGTTLVSEVLDAHSELAVSPETHYYNVFAHDCDRQGCLEDPERRRAYVDRLFDTAAVEQMALPADVDETILHRLADGEPSHREVLGTLLDAYAEGREATRWGEKTPRHLEHVPRILEDFPEARILCVVRDPRDVALSRADAGWASSTWMTVRDWRRHARLARDHERSHSDRFARTRYEDLLGDPEAWLEETCPFLDLEPEPGMLAFHETGSQTFDPEDEPWKQKAAQPIDPANREKWRDRMGAEDRWIVEHLVGDELEELAYPVPGTELSWRQRASVAASFAEHALRWTVHEARWFVDAKLRSPDYEPPLDEDA